MTDTTSYLPVASSAADFAWAAGIFEGEGSISVHRSRTGLLRMVLKVKMTDEDVVRRFAAVVGVGHVAGPYIDPQKPHIKPQWAWVASRPPHVAAVLRAFDPWLMSRRRAKVGEALAALEANRPLHRKNGDAVACLRGHSRSEHSYKGRSGYDICRECQRIWNQASSAKRKARQASSAA